MISRLVIAAGALAVLFVTAGLLPSPLRAGEPEAWRVDHRRPSGMFRGDAKSDVTAWRVDARRPHGLREGTSAHSGLSNVEWWRIDDRRPAPWPKGGVVEADSDGDGVVDSRDKCPDTPRGVEVDADGCPKDSDGDGVFDSRDKCPDTPRGVAVDADGCPMDSDGDGVIDSRDKCPDTPRGARVDEDGCEVSEKEAELLDTGTLRLENVLFETNSATLKPESFPVLNEVGEILVKWPQLKIEIGGHTDAQGTDEYNLDLSRRRAQSVLDYLTERFGSIKAGQYTVKGYGEAQPVATNDTREGRAKNRRVEFKVLNKEVLKK